MDDKNAKYNAWRRGRIAKAWNEFYASCGDPSFRRAFYLLVIPRAIRYCESRIANGRLAHAKWMKVATHPRPARRKPKPLPRRPSLLLKHLCGNAAFRMAFYHVCAARLKYVPRHFLGLPPRCTPKTSPAKAQLYKLRYKLKHGARIAAENRERTRRYRKSDAGRAVSKAYLSNPINMMVKTNRSRVNKVLKQQNAPKLSRSLVGCSREELMKHLESKFEYGMDWSNRGFGEGKWTVDHVRPLASFDLSIQSQQEEAFHYTNLKPMWFAENIRKSSRYNGRFWRHSDHRKEIAV